jgi:hypothetical protein
MDGGSIHSSFYSLFSLIHNTTQRNATQRVHECCLALALVDRSLPPIPKTCLHLHCHPHRGLVAVDHDDPYPYIRSVLIALSLDVFIACNVLVTNVAQTTGRSPTVRRQV